MNDPIYETNDAIVKDLQIATEVTSLLQTVIECANKCEKLAPITVYAPNNSTFESAIQAASESLQQAASHLACAVGYKFNNGVE